MRDQGASKPSAETVTNSSGKAVTANQETGDSLSVEPALDMEIGFEPGYEQVIWPLQRLMASDLPVDRKLAAVEITSGIDRVRDVHHERYIEMVPEAVSKGILQVTDSVLESIWHAGAVGGVLSKGSAMKTLAKIAPTDKRTLGMIEGVLESSYDPYERSAALVALRDIPRETIESRPTLARLAQKERQALDEKYNR